MIGIGVLASLTSHLSYVFPSFSHLSLFTPNFTFANPNLMAQFIGFCYILAFHCVLNTKSSLRYFLFSALIIFAFYLLELRCRSVILALALIHMAHLIQSKNKKKGLILFLLLILPLGFFFKKNSLLKDIPNVIEKIQHPNQNSPGSLERRYFLAQASLLAIKDHPFKGLGPYNFEFESLPYLAQTKMPIKMNYLYKTSHNSFLEIASEWGLLPGIIFILIWVFLGIKTFQSKQQILIFLYLYLWIELFFQFPLTSPYGSFIFCFYLALYFQRTHFPKPYSSKALGFISISLLLISLIRGNSYYRSVRSQNFDQVSFACDSYPLHWQACLRKAQLQIKSHKNSEALKTIDRSLEYSPHHYLFLELRSVKNSN